MKLLFIVFACILACTNSHAQGITLLYKNNLGWDNAQSWEQINQPVGQAPIQRVPTSDDDVVISFSMSGISTVGFLTDNTNPDFNVGGSNANGPSRCRSMHIRNTTFSIDNPSITDGAPEINVYTGSGGFVILDSGTNMLRGHLNLHGGNPAITDLQILHSNYGILFSHANWSSVQWKTSARLKMLGSKMGGYFFEGEPGANLFIDSSTIETNHFRIGENSTATLLNSKVTNNTNNNLLEFFIGKNTNFVSANDTVISFSILRFTTSGSQFNGNVTGMGQGPGDIDFLQADPANPLPNIINGNFSASELTTGLGISGDLKISGNFSGFPNDMFNNPIPVRVYNQLIFNAGGIKNYGSDTTINNCVQNFCHFKLEFFGNNNSNISWNGGFPIDTLIVNKTNCAKLTCDSSLFVSGAIRILGGQLRLDANENIAYKLVCAGNIDIAVGGGLFLQRNTAGIAASIAVGGMLVDNNANSDSLCVGFSNPYNGLVSFYRSSTVPLTLLQFNGKYKNNAVALNWSTIDELNSKDFIIEKSVDQVSFYPIGNVAASAQGPGKKDYHYIDNTPLQRSNYYRLKMVDIDGKYTYSKIVAIDVHSSLSFTLFPNPVSNSLWIRMPGIAGNASLTITDANGSLIKRMQLQAGTTNTFVNTADLPAGMYSISIQSNDVNYSQQFIKQ